MSNDFNHHDNNHYNNNLKSLYKERIKPKNLFKNTTKYFIISLISILSSLLIGFIISGSYVLIKNFDISNFSDDLDDTIVVSSNSDTSSSQLSVKNIIKKVNPSIVSITTISDSNDFFNISTESEGSGSGIIFHTTSSKTYILTNNHVIDGASQVGITINDSELIYASLVGKDENSDLAVISVLNSDIQNAGITDITVATFGNSDNMREGDSVIAIGNALGEGKTATLGIISSTSKDIYIDGKSLNVLQTTAAINPGNSGGALINSNGEVIGINTAKVADTDVSGIGYSISSNVAIPIIENIMNKSNSPALDVYISDVNSSYDGDFTLGALVVDVIDGGSADKAGILPNDIITSIEDTPIFNAEQLVQEIKNYEIGDTVKFKIIRDSEILTIKVKLKASVNKNTSF